MRRGCPTGGDLDSADFSKPLPWIGLYVAAASLLCAAAMAYDALSGVRRRKLWFPTRLFSLNATTLTLLGVATKFPVDLNTPMPSSWDQLTKLSGTVLICTSMGNLMPSLGSMDDSEVLSNVVALAILVITVVVNVCIQAGTGVIYVFLPEHAIVMLFMLVLLLILVSSAIAVPITKRLLGKEYDLKHVQQVEASSEKGDLEGSTGDRLEKLKTEVKKYWLMAHTCSPQYVLGRSATCTASGAFCLLGTLILVEALLRSLIRGSHLSFCRGTSDYQWSSVVVFFSQAVAVLAGTIAPAYRWFNAISFRSPERGGWNCKDEFRVEKYWVQRLTEWQEAPLPFYISRRQTRKIAHNSKNLILAVLIRLQAGVVLTSKFVRLASILLVSTLNKGRKLFRKLKNQPSSLTDESDFLLSNFVLCLEGEADLVELIMRSGRKDTEKWIQKGRKKQPTALTELIKQYSTLSEGFTCVGAFDSSNQVPSLVSEEPPNCWALPMVTLASIAIALPNVDQNSVDSLLKGLSQGLKYVRLIEKNLDAKGLMNMREAAEMVWLEIDLYDRWLDENLHSLVLEGKKGRNIIEKLRDVGKKYVMEFWVKSDCEARKQTLEWPEKILAANCMYRVSSTILQNYNNEHPTDADLFAWLRRTISDMLGACLTNLPRVIDMECFCSAIEVREGSVRNAAFLLGEAEDIMRTVGDPEVACLFPEEKEYIDGWLKNNQKKSSSLTSASSN